MLNVKSERPLEFYNGCGAAINSQGPGGRMPQGPYFEYSNLFTAPWSSINANNPARGVAGCGPSAVGVKCGPRLTGNGEGARAGQVPRIVTGNNFGRFVAIIAAVEG
jgi:hypothetical protein